MSSIVNCESESSVIVFPWRRYLARMLDIYLVGLLFYLFLVYFLRMSNLQAIDFYYKNPVLVIFLTAVATLLFNAFSFCATGTTLGKIIFGINILDENKQKLSFSQAAKREFYVLMHGLGFSIPILSLIMLVRSHRRLMLKKDTVWDEEMKCIVAYREDDFKQTILNVFGVLLSIAMYILTLGFVF